jgi:peptidoglycan hydrolase CwlO-like protein
MINKYIQILKDHLSKIPINERKKYILIACVIISSLTIVNSALRIKNNKKKHNTEWVDSTVQRDLNHITNEMTNIEKDFSAVRDSIYTIIQISDSIQKAKINQCDSLN